MKTKSLIVVLLCFFVGNTIAQEVRQKYLSLESGIDFIIGNTTKMDFIRGDIPSYYQMGEATNNLTTVQFKYYAGAKAEVFSLNNKFALSGGIRFTRFHGSIAKDSYWTTTSGFFYLLLNQDDTKTELLKIKEIRQLSSYVGLPLEFRFFPYTSHLVRIFFKAGLEFNVRVKSSTDVEFYNDNMNLYESQVDDIVGTPGNFCSVFNAGGGLRIGRPSKTCVSLETSMPLVYLTQETSGMMIPQAGVGFQFCILIPFNSSKQ